MPDEETTADSGGVNVTVNTAEAEKKSKTTKIIIGVLIIVVVVLIAIGIVLLATGHKEVAGGAGAAAAAAAAEAFRRRTQSRQTVRDAQKDGEAVADTIRENRESVDKDMADVRKDVDGMTDEEKAAEGNDLFGGGGS
jgi:uncharacterized protein HemX